MKEYFMNHPKLVWGIISLCLFSATFPFIVWIGNKDIAGLGQVGDSYNILATIVNIITVVFLGMTLSEQRKAFNSQQESMLEQQRAVEAQQQIMKKQHESMTEQQINLDHQLQEMKYSRSLETVKVLLAIIEKRLDCWSVARNYVAIEIQTIPGRIALKKAADDFRVLLEIGRCDLPLSSSVVAETRPILEAVYAATTISDKDDNIRKMIRCYIPNELPKLCMDATGGQIAHSSYNQYMTNETIKSFRELFDSIPKWVWQNDQSIIGAD